jgi:hypothetical protein
MADTISAIERVVSQNLFEISELSFGAANLELVTLVYYGDARRIVATIFKLAQAVDDQRHHLFVSDVSDYSTHIVSSEQ